MTEYQNVAKERDNFAIRIGQSRAVDVDNLRLQIDQLKSELDTAIKAKENLQRQMLDDGMSKSTIESFKAKAAAYDALDGVGFLVNTSITGSYENKTQVINGYLLFFHYLKKVLVQKLYLNC